MVASMITFVMTLASLQIAFLLGSVGIFPVRDSVLSWRVFLKSEILPSVHSVIRGLCCPHFSVSPTIPALIVHVTMRWSEPRSMVGCAAYLYAMCLLLAGIMI